MDFVSAMEMVTSTLTVLQEQRSETHFNEYFSISEEKCTELGIMEQELPPPKHRRMSSKIADTISVKHRHLTGKDKYRIEFFCETLEIMINALKNRFSAATCDLLRRFSVLHPTKPLNGDISEIKVLGRFYRLISRRSLILLQRPYLVVFCCRL